MRLSIIIPTLNEAENIARLVPYLRSCMPEGQGEIIVVDGHSDDETLSVARQHGVDQVLTSPNRGRAAQMNYAAQMAKGDILYFVHADTLPADSFCRDISETLNQGYEAGTFRSRFETRNPLMKVNAYVTRFDRLFLRGGDQSIFIRRDAFEELGRYREDYRIMEDFDLIQKLRDRKKFKILPKSTLISTRKYIGNGYFRVNFANLVIVTMYRMGASQEKMVNTYKTLLNYR